MATGGSQTDAVALSTGGTRPLALGTAIYLCGSLILALLNLELPEHTSKKMVHMAVAACALFGIVVAEGRTNFVALAVILPLLVLFRRRLTASAMQIMPLALPFAALAGIFLTPSFRRSAKRSQIAWRGHRETISTWRGDWPPRTPCSTASRTQSGADSGSVERPSSRCRKISCSSQRACRATPHDSFIWILAGGGLVAFIPLLVLLGSFAIDTLRRLRADVRARARFSPSGHFSSGSCSS